MTVEEKALELVAENRVVVLNGSTAIVAGHHDHYHVVAATPGVECSCPARGTCAHALAAMIVWHERAAELTPPW